MHPREEVPIRNVLDVVVKARGYKTEFKLQSLLISFSRKVLNVVINLDYEHDLTFENFFIVHWLVWL